MICALSKHTRVFCPRVLTLWSIAHLTWIGFIRLTIHKAELAYQTVIYKKTAIENIYWKENNITPFYEFHLYHCKLLEHDTIKVTILIFFQPSKIMTQPEFNVYFKRHDLKKIDTKIFCNHSLMSSCNLLN